jgi:hypothetical protein
MVSPRVIGIFYALFSSSRFSRPSKKKNLQCLYFNASLPCGDINSDSAMTFAARRSSISGTISKSST